MLIPYRPEPYVDFTQSGPRCSMLQALDSVSKALGRDYPLHIGGKPVSTAEHIRSLNPAQCDQVVGRVGKATGEQVDTAIRLAAQAFRSWSAVPGEVRARVLLKAAAIMRRQRHELCAWLCYEVSKSWIEAYAEVCEAIDFLEFYAREMMRLDGAQGVTPLDGQENELRYIPMGVVAVISPWNFPLAITAGMTAAALVTGNAVVLKPASTAPVIAAKLVEILLEAGLPPEVLSFVPGSGSRIGDVMVQHPLTRIIAFTGSMAVGLRVFELASRLSPGQVWLKRSILEMGGKDCILVDETADLDAAAAGIVASAFGFQGQKCSACSRVVALAPVYEGLIERVAAGAKALTIGLPCGAENPYLGAVIDEGACGKIREYIEIGSREGRAVLGGAAVPSGGYFVPPTIFADVDPGARIAREEIFGPVLAMMKAGSFDEALDIANGTPYGLTGAVYSNDRLRLERARREFHAGNLYFNRKCTGALVGVQPFGGFNMSGTDSKAGGSDYLQLFLQAKSICEQW